MQDAFAYCAALVRAADHDRYLAALFAPADRRDALFALYAFNIEVARVREAAREPMPGEIRLQWWGEVVGGERAEEARANPVAAALMAAIERHHLPIAKFAALIAAHRFDLYNEPMTDMAEFDGYARRTSSALISLAARVLADDDAEAAANPAGIALSIMNLLRAFPQHASRGQLFQPLDVIERRGASAEDIFAGRVSGGLRAALGDMRDLAQEHLASAREPIGILPREALPAFLPVALVRPSLDLLSRSDPFSPRELSPWRRQWLIWRAARNPARIAR
ncbi:MAG TPA: phytoene/squalene synthase family protein [Xanthobacteraceae bacterium]|nr:phytoene/squalene synthase family protein [Xanthobacteraceae bacterium]